MQVIDSMVKHLQAILAKEEEYMVAQFMKHHHLTIDQVELVLDQSVPGKVIIYPRKKIS